MKKQQPIFENIQTAVKRRYGSFKRINSRAMVSTEFKTMVREVFSANGADIDDKKYRTWYETIMTWFASKGGSKNRQKSKMAQKETLRNQQQEFKF